MDSPHSGYHSQSVELLRIETNLFDFYIKGKPYHPTVEALHLHRDQKGDWVKATVEVVADYPILKLDSAKIFSPHTNGLVDLWQGDCFPCFYEYQDYQVVIQAKSTECNLQFHHVNRLLRQAIAPLGKGILAGVLNFQSDVGYTDLEIRSGDTTLLNIRLEIFPSKLDYKNDYEQILAEVNEQIYNLSFDFLRKTYNLTGLRHTQSQSLTEFFSILQMVFEQVVKAIDRIQANPQYRLEKENRIVIADRVKRPGKENLSFLGKNPQRLVKDPDFGVLGIGAASYRPTHLIESSRRTNFDTNENRFLKWVLKRIESKLKEIQFRLRSKEKTPDKLLTEQIDRMISQISRLLKYDFLQAAGEIRQLSVTLVLQMAPGYRDVYRYYLMLMKGLSIQRDLFRLSLKDLAVLYEYWCFLKIHSLLKNKYELVKQDIIKVNRTGLFVTLDKTQSASVTYRNPKNGETFTLFYNALPTEDKEFPTLSQRPDNVLTLKKQESDIEYKYVFDSKYRLNPAFEGTAYQRDYKTPGPQEDDINTMHRYRDAIVYQDLGKETFERSMFGAYVLFPYGNEEEFQEHRFYKSIQKVNVGAFPFLPNSTKLMEEFLDELIIDSPEKAFERSIQPRGTEKYYEDKLSGKNVLVGSMRAVDQLEDCLRHKFYYMPLKNVLNEQKLLTQLEYVALYQSRKRWGNEAGIRWYGRISSWTVVPRIEIKERAVRRENPDELYVRIEIKKWVALNRLIEPGGYGIYSHLFTTLYMFERALEIADLKIESEEQMKKWREKRRKGKVRVELDREHVDKAGMVKISEEWN